MSQLRIRSVCKNTDTTGRIQSFKLTLLPSSNVKDASSNTEAKTCKTASMLILNLSKECAPTASLTLLAYKWLIIFATQSLRSCHTFLWRFGHLQCCGRRSCGLDPQQPERRSWAWWRPGWGWWICDDLWVCGKTRAPWKTKETKHSVWLQRGGRRRLFEHLCRHLTGLWCWRWRRHFPLGSEWSSPSLPAQRWPAEAPTAPLGPPPPLLCHHCPPPPPYSQAERARSVWLTSQTGDGEAAVPCLSAEQRATIPSRPSRHPFCRCKKQISFMNVRHGSMDCKATVMYSICHTKQEIRYSHSFLSPSSVLRDSASAKLSTAIAKKTFSRISECSVKDCTGC